MTFFQLMMDVCMIWLCLSAPTIAASLHCLPSHVCIVTWNPQYCCCSSVVVEAPPAGQEGSSGSSISDGAILPATSATPTQTIPTAASYSPASQASTVKALTERCSHMEVSNNTEGIQGHFRVKLTSLSSFLGGICFTPTCCSFTGLCDESHTSDLFVPPVLWLFFSSLISQPASLHVAVIPSAGFCVQLSQFFFLGTLSATWTLNSSCSLLV